MDIRSIIHHLRQGVSERQASRDLGINRDTIRRYHSWAKAQGLMRGELPAVEVLQQMAEKTLKISSPPQNTSSVAPYCAIVRQLLDEGVEMAAIHQRLIERGYTGSYASVYRFSRQIVPKEVDAVVRVERAPGEEAQVDFGYAGRMIDPDTDQLRRTWAFVMTWTEPLTETKS